jgi:hypothetical protein
MHVRQAAKITPILLKARTKRKKAWVANPWFDGNKFCYTLVEEAKVIMIEIKAGCIKLD